MNWLVVERNTVADAYHTAGVKARDDAEKILIDAGCKELIIEISDDRDNAGKLDKLLVHFKLLKEWNKTFSPVQKGDVVYIQFPVVNHTLVLDRAIKKLVDNGVKVVALIHDLEVLRLSLSDSFSKVQKWRLKREEVSVMNLFSKIIVHNESMLEYMNQALGIPKEKMVNLEIFDYLIDNPENKKIERTSENYKSVIIAGNLSQMKAAYAYDLPEETQFVLYGPNYTGKTDGNITYKGSFPPDVLPFVLEGGFGLVWDGISSTTCEGVWGEYLKYNNPHKTSLYLASQLPLVIWEKAALSDFVVKNGCGITVASLFDIPEAINKVTEEEYKSMLENTKEVSKKLVSGYYLLKAADCEKGCN